MHPLASGFPATRSLRPAFAGASATFSGLGLGRFAYVPLFPAMVTAGWVTGAEAGLLGALNLAGYLVGVLGGRSLARRLGTGAALNVGMALVVLSFAACGWNGGTAWLAAWRCLVGVAGGILMVLAGPAVQGAVSPAQRGLAGGIVMTGVATGVVTSAVAVPMLLPAGLSATWLGLAALVVLLWLFAGRAWPGTPVPAPTRGLPAGTGVLTAAYGLSAAGLVPHMVYFADLVVRGRGLDLLYASLAWVLFGVGGLAGPLLGGRAADRWGARPVVRAWLLFQVGALALVFVPHPAALMSAALLGGFASIGLTAVTLARARELAGAGAGAVWARTTAAFAVAQAVTGFALAALFARTGSHDALFATGLALSAAALLPTLLPERRLGADERSTAAAAHGRTPHGPQ